jgi:hypothetical protein
VLPTTAQQIGGRDSPSRATCPDNVLERRERLHTNERLVCSTVYQQTEVNMEVWVGVFVAVVEVVVIVGVGFWLVQRRRRRRTLSGRGRGGVAAHRSRNDSPTDLSDEHARS